MAAQSWSFEKCVSDEELGQRALVTVVNVLVWGFLAIWTLMSLGILLIVFGFGWLLRFLLADYHVRLFESLGATVSPRQFPEVYAAATHVCQIFGSKQMPRIIVVSSGESNAFAIRFARQKVVVILSELLEAVIDDPAQLRFLLAHEMCHGALDHGARGVFEISKPAAYRQARELTCDNAGLVAAGNLPAAKQVLRKMCVGRHLQGRLSDEALVADAARINSGFTGWMIRQSLTHPPAGSRVRNLDRFAARVFGPAAVYAAQPQSPAGPAPHLSYGPTAAPQPYFGQPSAHPAHGQPQYGQPPYGQPAGPQQAPYGQPAAAPPQPPYGRPPAAPQPPYGQQPGTPPSSFGPQPGAPQPPYGQPGAGQPPYG